MTFLYISMVIILFLMAWDSIAHGSRISAVILLTLSLGVSWIGLIDLLSRPKPLSYEFRAASEVTLISSYLDEGNAIYLWIVFPESSVPRAYALPWSRDRAEQLQKARARARAQADGTQVRIRHLFESSWDDSDIFHVPPQPRMPEKIPDNPLLLP